MNKKLIIVSIIIILALLGGFGYWKMYAIDNTANTPVINNENTNFDNANNKGIDTGEWTEYRNSVYKFSMMHPENIKIVVYAGDPSLAETDVRFCYLDDCMWLMRYWNVAELDAEKFVNETWQQNKEDNRPNVAMKNVGEIESRLVDEVKLYSFDITKSFLSEGISQRLEASTKAVFFYRNGEVLILYPSDNKIFEEMISSLRFY